MKFQFPWVSRAEYEDLLKRVEALEVPKSKPVAIDRKPEEKPRRIVTSGKWTLIRQRLEAADAMRASGGNSMIVRDIAKGPERA